ncbi:alpha/beta hydrolase-fold protein [Alteromonas sp. ASW11-36]|uniref:Alpha/beta hydrolase-fold protein n=1 Tax=Alteromonas arenosi TaxID=3055817 RepID=A0ABT7SWC9_9ALTE|nr:alpha/beta hydrolase-fold protein [Alteromonas sp. ASW11-36]MDM7860496.1 alpha/beta hydrolase-fold protein [Alteromonas sp. ASW11-36]
MRRGLPFFALVTMLFSLLSHADIDRPLNQVSSGQLDTIGSFESAFIPSRRIQVWRPDNYNSETKYSVIYMHDGQMLFDATTTWNNQEWRVDEVAGKLQAEQQTRPFIVVGIDNGGDQRRYLEYLPQKPYMRLSAEQKVKLFTPLTNEPIADYSTIIESDKYLRFIVEELKPYIDTHYSVHTDKHNTFIMGSSMGGLISMYALAEYPNVFGAAACVSTHWVGGSTSQENPITAEFMHYLKNDFPAPGEHRIYFDYGDQTLDAIYPPLQAQVDKIMTARGYEQTN